MSQVVLYYQIYSHNTSFPENQWTVHKNVNDFPKKYWNTDIFSGYDQI